ncbi:hypothetical protein ACFL2T_06675 [Elusimicrobiota bacterium]
MVRYLGAIWAVSLMAGSLCAAGKKAAEPASHKLGAGSQELVVDALRVARTNWSDDACFSQLHYYHTHVRPGSSLVPEVFHFFFHSPTRPKRSFLVSFSAGLPLSHEEHAKRGGSSCITEMSVDSGDAIEIALADGLRYGVRDKLDLKLYYFEDRSEMPIWAGKRLMGRTFWRACVGGRCRVVDAATGELISPVDMELKAPKLKTPD